MKKNNKVNDSIKLVFALLISIIIYLFGMAIKNGDVVFVVSFTLGITIFKLFLSLIYRPKYPKKNAIKRTVTAIMPNYNEKISNVKKGFDTLLRQEYEIDQFIFVDDGSDSDEAYNYVKELSKNDTRIQAFRTIENNGKKAAQLLAFQHVTSDYVLLFDTDSLLDSNSLGNLMAAFDNRDTGAVVGTIKVSNKKTNFIVNMQKLLYTSAFRFARSAQSMTGCVSVCSGAFSVFKFRIIKKNIHKFTGKTAGVDMVAGDDRLLTSIVLEAGFKTKYQSNAICYTEVPNNVKSFLKQQIRWAKSGYILALYSIKMIFKNPFIPFWQWMDAYIWVFNTVLAVFLIITSLFFTLNNESNMLYIDSVFMMRHIGISSLYFLGNYGISNFYIAKENFSLFLRGFFHKIFYAFLLLYIRIRAILTIKKNTWGTR
ncbi:glycosyltransferase [Erysipelothrix anatis]|uniref:glycosyltransferase n=1 Tax=Erysipelothrix anatis TaxID=2683713 RepID=UPI001359E830|nr:glycosyltransferase family 2 protein [Erysipelothrix anatis]